MTGRDRENGLPKAGNSDMNKRQEKLTAMESAAIAGEGGYDGEAPEGGRCPPAVAGPAVHMTGPVMGIVMFQVRGRNLNVALPGVKVSRPQMQVRCGWYLWKV